MTKQQVMRVRMGMAVAVALVVVVCALASLVKDNMDMASLAGSTYVDNGMTYMHVADDRGSVSITPAHGESMDHAIARAKAQLGIK